MSILSSFKISGSALTAQRLRMDVIANNIANAETTQSDTGGPYKRQDVVFTPARASMQATRPGGSLKAQPADEGVRVAAIVRQDTPPRLVYEPDNPQSNDEGYVAYPDIDIITEMTDMMSASRAYEANITAITVAKSMASKALEIAR